MSPFHQLSAVVAKTVAMSVCMESTLITRIGRSGQMPTILKIELVNFVV